MTKIYALKNTETNQTVYVGKTKRTLDQRLKEHRTDLKHPDKTNYLNSNPCEIVLLTECEDLISQQMEEYYIKQFDTIYFFNKIYASKYKNVNDKDKIIKHNTQKAKWLIEKGIVKKPLSEEVIFSKERQSDYDSRKWNSLFE